MYEGWREKTEFVAAIAVASYVDARDVSVKQNVTIIADRSSSTEWKLNGVITKSNVAVTSNRQVFPALNLSCWLCNLDFKPDVAVYSVTGEVSMTYLIMHSQRHWQRSSFPLLIIENRSGKQLPCTARQCTIKCIELFCLRRSYGDNSSSVVGFVLPDLHQAHKNLHTTI